RYDFPAAQENNGYRFAPCRSAERGRLLGSTDLTVWQRPAQLLQPRVGRLGVNKVKPAQALQFGQVLQPHQRRSLWCKKDERLSRCSLCGDWFGLAAPLSTGKCQSVQTEAHAQPVAAETVVRRTIVAVGRAAISGNMVPGTASQHTGFAFFWSRRVNRVFCGI